VGGGSSALLRMCVCLTFVLRARVCLSVCSCVFVCVCLCACVYGRVCDGKRKRVMNEVDVNQAFLD
jgi:hypothetical protein